MNRPRTYRQRVDREVEAVRWGPSWAEMREAAIWLGTRGINFRFDESRRLPDDEEITLPPLFIFDRRWEMDEVRRGDWLVVIEQGRVRVMSDKHFREEHQ